MRLLKLFAILTSPLGICSFVSAQIVMERNLISSGGQSFTGANIQADWSVGEVVIDQSNRNHPQGFHQFFDRMGMDAPNEIFHTVVTPNGDQLNDQLNVGEAGLTVDVLDRWGNTVFSAVNYQNDWTGTQKSGTLLPDGVYIILIRSINGNLLKSGTITIKSR
jgi:gliding motility-associated-like protein